MKKTLISILTLIMALCAFGLGACTKKEDKHTQHKFNKGYCSCGEVNFTYTTEGLKFELVEDNTKYMVAGYEGEDTDVVIPSTYQNKPVAIIKEEAFKACTSIQRLALGKSVKQIQKNAFTTCTGLTSVTYEKDSTLESIAEYAFSNCGKLESMQLPDSLTFVGEYAFRGCSKLNYTIKGDLKYLGNSQNPYICLIERTNTTMTEATIESTCKFIDIYAFKNCDKLETIIIPSSVLVMHFDVFYNCSALTVYCEAQSKPAGWSDDWNAIGNPVVWNCNNNSVADDGYLYTIINGFRYGLKDGKAVVARQVNTITQANIPDSVTYNGTTYVVTSIAERAFYGCNQLPSIQLPSTLTSVGKEAFMGCNSLQYKTSNGCKYLGNSNNEYLYLADTTSSTITYATINSACKIIGYDSFADCASLRSIELPDSVIGIDANAFSGCSALTRIKLSKNLINIGENAFNGCTWLTYNVKGNLKYLGSTTNQYLCLITNTNTSMKEVSIDANCKIIAPKAFANCGKLTTITIPSSVIGMGSKVFENCTSITIYCEAKSKPTNWKADWNMLNSPVVWDCINNSVASDGYIYTIIDGINYSLKNGKATIAKQIETLLEATIPSTVTFKGVTYTVTTISENAFSACGSLAKVTIPNSVANVDNTALEGLSSLIIYCEAQSKPSGWGSLWNQAGNPVIWDCKNNNVADDGNIYTIIDGVNYALKDDKASVVRQVITIAVANIPQTVTYKNKTYTVTTIIDKAFYGCELLTDVSLPKSLTKIGHSAFEGCSSLKELTLPSSLFYIGEKAFYGCSKITKMVIPLNVKQIGRLAFVYCDSLTDLTFERAGVVWRRTDRFEVWETMDSANSGGLTINIDGAVNATNLRNDLQYGNFYLFLN